MKKPTHKEISDFGECSDKVNDVLFCIDFGDDLLMDIYYEAKIGQMEKKGYSRDRAEEIQEYVWENDLD